MAELRQIELSKDSTCTTFAQIQTEGDRPANKINLK